MYVIERFINLASCVREVWAIPKDVVEVAPLLSTIITFNILPVAKILQVDFAKSSFALNGA